LGLQALSSLSHFFAPILQVKDRLLTRYFS
jgi:hypothetical protein